MRILLALLMGIMALPTNAETYIDLGIGVAETSYRYHHETKRYCGYYECINYDTADKPDNPYGLLEIGYKMNNVSFFFLNMSSIRVPDGGINMAGIKYRFTL